MTNEELKQNFNKTLELINRGGKYLNDPKISDTDKDTAIPKFIKLLDRACNLIYTLQQRGVCVLENNMLIGFQIGGDENE